MISFKDISLDINDLCGRRKPNFQNLLKVLRRERPDRYTLFEFFLNHDLEKEILGLDELPCEQLDYQTCRIAVAEKLGYDYVTLGGSGFYFETKRDSHGKASVSMNEGALITDLKSYHAYHWNNPADYDTSDLEKLAKRMPDGMKCIVFSCDGLLENVINLTGYDNLCYMLADDPALVQEIFDQVGSRLLQYYEQVVEYDFVGALISNDDWGFKTQTMLSISDMRKYVFPWHKRFAQVAHRHGKPILLHSCGQLDDVMDDIAYGMKFDGKHSYEDAILPVEQAYERYHDRVAVLGGIDIDFLCRSTPEEVYNRSLAILKQTGGVGYALGSGNSIPYYVPHQNYLAMVAAAVYNEME